jgi:hypothetical protein
MRPSGVQHTGFTVPTRRQALWGVALGSAAVLASQLSNGAAADAAAGGDAMPSKLQTKVVAFDVIETLFDLSPMGQKLKAIGLQPELLPVWFARLLRDAMALDASGVFKPFPEIATSILLVRPR